MKFEIWSLASGNRLAVFPQVDDAMGWLVDVYNAEGEEAFETLSLGDTAGGWTLEGQDLLTALRGPWLRTGPLTTGVEGERTEPHQLVAVA